jgi:hypothetical protein
MGGDVFDVCRGRREFMDYSLLRREGINICIKTHNITNVSA